MPKRSKRPKLGPKSIAKRVGVIFKKLKAAQARRIKRELLAKKRKRGVRKRK